MQFLTISNRSNPIANLDEELREAEIRRAKVLYAEGRIRQLWHRADDNGACVLWEADDESHLERMLQSLPFVEAQIVEVLVFALRPYSGFAPDRVCLEEVEG